MNALVKPEPTTMPMAFGDMERLADAIAKSNLFGLRTREQALVLMMISHAEGRHPALAARDYDVISGRPSKKAEAMLRDFLQAGGRVEWHALSDEIADATFTHPQGGSARIAWDMARATKAQLAGNANYKKFPRQMLRSRVVSEGVRTVYPLATSGLYVPEEVADFNGHTIEADKPSEARQAINDATPMQPLRSAAAATPRAPRVVDPTPYEAPPPKPVDRSQWTDGMWRSWIDAKLRPELDKLTTREEVAVLAEKTSVRDAIDPDKAPEWVRRDVNEILADYHRSLPEAEPGDDLDEVAIKGEEHLAAG